MSGAQFPVGPWTASVEARPHPARDHWYVVLDGEENGLGEFYGDDHDANVANVRMAAAAPELCKALAEIAESARGGDPLARDRDEDTLAAIARHADRALAKARGEQ